MFSGIRLRLTLLYTLAAMALVVLIGAGAYLVVARYFRDATDLALRHKMTHEFHALAAPIPPELASADRDWSIVRGELVSLPRPGNTAELSQQDAVERAVAYLRNQGGAVVRVELKSEHGRAVYEVRFSSGARVTVERAGGRILDAAGGEEDAPDDETGDDAAFDGELAAIYVLPLDAAGGVLFDPGIATAAIAPDAAALASALAGGSDLRTVTLPDGQRARLLTYRLTRPTGSAGPAALQLGRVLSDQEQVLWQLAVGLVALGSASMLLVGAGSWWLAGRALRPAQQAWERQQRFIASASHELRTPLTLIRASAEVALRDAPAEQGDQRELLGDVVAETDHMRRLVDDLLMLSRLDSGQLPLTPGEVELAPLLGDIQRQAERLAAQRAVRVTLGDVAGVARADPDRLRQLLLILIDNALRHTPAGGEIRLQSQRHGRTVELCVADTGSGIAPEHLPHIFERFYRADPARGRDSGNAGLGLSIAQSLASAMGGQIRAESELQRGTTMRLTLPCG